MKTGLILSTLAVALWLPLHWAAAADVSKPDDADVKIGIYDSRAVAVAFTGSEAFKTWMAPFKAEQQKAKAAADAARLKELDQQMRANQVLRHKQAFSTAPVDDLLKFIEGGLGRIKQEAGVKAIVSKWDEAGLKQYKTTEKIDITERLVDEFHPTPRQRRSALEIQKHKPISLAEAEKIAD